MRATCRRGSPPQFGPARSGGAYHQLFDKSNARTGSCGNAVVDVGALFVPGCVCLIPTSESEPGVEQRAPAGRQMVFRTAESVDSRERPSFVAMHMKIGPRVQSGHCGRAGLRQRSRWWRHRNTWSDGRQFVEVDELAETVAVPEEIIDRNPGAEQEDEGSREPCGMRFRGVRGQGLSQRRG